MKDQDSFDDSGGDEAGGDGSSAMQSERGTLTSSQTRKLLVSIPKATVRAKQGNKFVSYDVVVQVDERRWVVHRRFRDFCTLDEVLALGTSERPQLPQKLWWGNFHESTVNRRREALENYLVFLVSDTILSKEDAVIDFLGARSTLETDHDRLTSLDSFGFVMRSGRFTPLTTRVSKNMTKQSTPPPPESSTSGGKTSRASCSFLFCG